MMQAREFLSKLGDLNQTQIFAKIENIEVQLALGNLYNLVKTFNFYLLIDVYHICSGFESF